MDLCALTLARRGLGIFNIAKLKRFPRAWPREDNLPSTNLFLSSRTPVDKKKHFVIRRINFSVCFLKQFYELFKIMFSLFSPMTTLNTWKILETEHNDNKIVFTLALKFAKVIQKHVN